MTFGAGATRPGRRVFLRPVYPSDYDWLYTLATSGTSGYQWRYRGATPSPDTFTRQLWDGVLAQFVVETVRDRRPIGLVALYNANFAAQYVYCAALTSPTHVGSGLTMDAVVLLLDGAFRNWGFSKVYFEIPEFNAPQFGSALTRYLETEGRLVNHEFVDGRHWDTIIAAFLRSQWDAVAPRWMRAIMKAV